MLAKASTLKRKHNLEEREAQLKREKENLEIQTALAASDDKIQILDEFEGFRISSRASSRNGMDSYVGLKHSSHTDRQAAQGKDIQPNVQRTASATAQPQPQALETLQSYQMLTNQHRLALLHPQSTPVFKGDPLECLLFIRAFEPQGRLYFIEQYTAGQPRELVWSCLHMEPERGYCEAKRLLEEHFGNAYKLSVAYQPFQFFCDCCNQNSLIMWHVS